MIKHHFSSGVAYGYYLPGNPNSYFAGTGTPN